MLKIALVAALVCAAACKDKKKETESQPAAKTPEAPPPTPTPTPAPPPAVLKIEAAKLTIQRAKQAKKNPDDPDGLALEASGDVKVDTKVVAKVTPDGKLADATGKTVATMTADGKVAFEGESETLTIAEDGTITKAGKELVKIGADGMFVGDMTKEMSEKVKYEGPPTGRRALMFAFLAAMTPGQQKAPPPTTKEEPAKPTPTKEPAKPKAKPKK